MNHRHRWLAFALACVLMAGLLFCLSRSAEAAAPQFGGGQTVPTPPTRVVVPDITTGIVPEIVIVPSTP